MLSKSTNEDVRVFIYDWNSRFPLDRWWRQKHKVAFNSPEHRESCFIDQLIEYYEDKFFDDLGKTVDDTESVPPYKRGHGNWLLPRSSEITKQEEQELFDNYEI